MCVSNMNGPTRLKFYKMIVNRDGEYCKGCGALQFEKQLVVDHRDNNNSNNSLDNLQLLCRRCNYLKNPRPFDKCVSESDNFILETEIQVNRTKEPQFKQYIAQRMNESKIIPQEDLIYASAERLDLSPVTTKRYLDKRCSSDGAYQKVKVGNTIYIKYKDELMMV